MKMNFFNSKTVPVLKSHDVWLGCVCIEMQKMNKIYVIEYIKKSLYLYINTII